MKNTRFVALGLLLLMIFSLLTGCSNIKYNAMLYSKANEWIDESFLKDNRVKAYYLNDNYISGESDPSDKYIYDTNLPLSRVFIVTDENEYNRIFSNSPLDVNFEQEMIILYIFSDVNPTRDYNLKRIEVNDKILTVQMKLERKDVDDATMPYQRCVVIKMNKVEITEVKLE